MSLLSKTDLLTEDGELYETQLDVLAGTCCAYCLVQSTNNLPPINKGSETVLMNRGQAVSIAKTILRNEGYDIA